MARPRQQVTTDLARERKGLEERQHKLLQAASHISQRDIPPKDLRHYGAAIKKYADEIATIKERLSTLEQEWVKAVDPSPPRSFFS